MAATLPRLALACSLALTAATPTAWAGGPNDDGTPAEDEKSTVDGAQLEEVPAPADDDDPWRDVRLALRPPPEAGAAVTAEPRVPFDRSFGLAAYYARWAGAYDSGGLGLRLRWEPLELLGLELFAEGLDVTVAAGRRVDVPVGFNLYVPLDLLDGLRVRALGGLCAMLSLATGSGPDAPDAQDIQFGAHLGLGAELALGDRFSLFLDATYQGYWGHGQTTATWTAALSDELRRKDSVELGLGLQLHL